MESREHSAVVRFRSTPAQHARLARLRDERHVNVSAWLRHVVDRALEAELGPPDRTGPGAPPAPAGPLPGWRPAKLPDGGWGARYDGDASALPAELAGLRIEIRPRSGQPWLSTVAEVVRRGSSRVVVRHSGKP